MEDNRRESKHLPWPLLIVMGIGGTIIASLLTSMVALAGRGNVFVGVLSAITIVLAIVISRDDGSDNNDVQSLLVAYPLFISGFAFGYIAGYRHLTLTLVLQFVVALLSFALSKIHLCQQMLLCYASVVLPLIFFSYFDHLFSGRAMKDGNIEMSCFAIIVAYMGIFAATIRDNWFASIGIKDDLKTIRFATAAVSVALLWFIHRDNTAFAIFFAIISFVIACILLRKYVTGRRLIEGYVLALLCCASTAAYPAMALPITGMLLSFWLLDYVCLVIFSVAFICGISFFYYDLQMLLINKSYLLMASGALFLLAFYYIKRVTK